MAHVSVSVSSDIVSESSDARVASPPCCCSSPPGAHPRAPSRPQLSAASAAVAAGCAAASTARAGLAWCGDGVPG
eukprot:COSAG01_NODE_14298_length_1471_cov_7.934402_1_plen_74_part_10